MNKDNAHSMQDDIISRQEAIKAIEDVTWYRQNCNGDMVWGANDTEHQAWYKSQDIYDALESLPSADRQKGTIHIDDVYRLIAGHSDYHGDSILSAFTCLTEGKDVKPITPLDESADRPKGKWIDTEPEIPDLSVRKGNKPYVCSVCGHSAGKYKYKTYKFCPWCGAEMKGE